MWKAPRPKRKLSENVAGQQVEVEVGSLTLALKIPRKKVKKIKKLKAKVIVNCHKTGSKSQELQEESQKGFLVQLKVESLDCWSWTWTYTAYGNGKWQTGKREEGKKREMKMGKYLQWTHRAACHKEKTQTPVWLNRYKLTLTPYHGQLLPQN